MAAIVLPTRRDEAWKYSDLRAALSDHPAPDGPAADARKPVIVQLAGALGRQEHVDLAPGEEAERIDRMEAAVYDAAALHVEVPAGASMSRIIVQHGDAVALNFTRVRLGQGARYRQFVLAFGSKLARIETHVEVEGEGATVDLSGAYLCGPGKHVDLTSVVTHKVGHSHTRQLIKGVARAGGRGVFQGKILVAEAAQKTDAEQHHDALLLEEGAEIYAKPELEIYADDVACAHGNTAGSLDPRALFYMRARGVPEVEARALLTQAFLMQAVPEWLSDAAASEAQAQIESWLRMAP
jgi:Fe-S cluster assembly protein SufD